MIYYSPFWMRRWYTILWQSIFHALLVMKINDFWSPTTMASSQRNLLLMLSEGHSLCLLLSPASCIKSGRPLKSSFFFGAASYSGPSASRYQHSTPWHLTSFKMSMLPWIGLWGGYSYFSPWILGCSALDSLSEYFSAWYWYSLSSFLPSILVHNPT